MQTRKCCISLNHYHNNPLNDRHYSRGCYQDEIENPLNMKDWAVSPAYPRRYFMSYSLAQTINFTHSSKISHTSTYRVKHIQFDDSV